MNHILLSESSLSLVGELLNQSVPLSQASIPFAVVGSNQQIEAKGKKVRGRLYPWGVVEVENPEHNDFLKLRIMLMWVTERKSQAAAVGIHRSLAELHRPKLCHCESKNNYIMVIIN